jgi:transcriptional regulator GlxA family with amidase domain
MAEENGTFVIGIPIYQGVDLLDVAAPFEVFNWMGEKWTDARQVKVYLLAETNPSLPTRDGLQLTPHKTFDEVAGLDLLWVPGGDPTELAKRMQDRTFLDFLRRVSERATYVTSVCEGALLLASAGLLDGYEATTHWAFLPCLKKFSGITVAEGHPRFVVCDQRDEGRGLRVTGGGVSSGLDEALELVRLIGGDDLAKEVQLVIQYFPKPPVHADIPKKWDTCPLPTLS